MVDWAPLPSDVGAILHARTKDSGGNEIGTFTDATRPTDVQVGILIGQAVDDVISELGTENLPIGQATANATAIAALGSALLVEVSYFPEQVGSGRSPFAQLKQMYDDRLKRLKLLIESLGTDAPESEFMMPAGAFGGPPVPTSWYTPSW